MGNLAPESSRGLARTLCTGVGAFFLFISPVALSQEDTETTREERVSDDTEGRVESGETEEVSESGSTVQLDRISVTGTRIRRVDLADPAGAGMAGLEQRIPMVAAGWKGNSLASR